MEDENAKKSSRREEDEDENEMHYVFGLCVPHTYEKRKENHLHLIQ